MTSKDIMSNTTEIRTRATSEVQSLSTRWSQKKYLDGLVLQRYPW